MNKKTNICKVINISLALLLSTLHVASAMEGYGNKEKDIPGHLTGQSLPEELKASVELRDQIRAEVNRVLENFQNNMNAYYQRTQNPKRIFIIPDSREASAPLQGNIKDAETVPVPNVATATTSATTVTEISKGKDREENLNPVNKGSRRWAAQSRQRFEDKMLTTRYTEYKEVDEFFPDLLPVLREENLEKSTNYLHEIFKQHPEAVKPLYEAIFQKTKKNPLRYITYRNVYYPFLDALSISQDVAEKLDATTQKHIGNAYRSGLIINDNQNNTIRKNKYINEAVHYFLLSAQQGDKESIDQLLKLLLSGKVSDSNDITPEEEAFTRSVKQRVQDTFFQYIQLINPDDKQAMNFLLKMYFEEASQYQSNWIFGISWPKLKQFLESIDSSQSASIHKLLALRRSLGWKDTWQSIKEGLEKAGNPWIWEYSQEPVPKTPD